MKRIALAAILLAGCGKKSGEVQTVVHGSSFDEASLVEKEKITILDFSADW